MCPEPLPEGPDTYTNTTRDGELPYRHPPPAIYSHSALPSSQFKTTYTYVRRSHTPTPWA